MNKAVLDNDYYVFLCPHCKDYVITHKNEIACSIYRHAVYKSSFQQIGPHTPKHICDQLKANDEVYGCACPFKLNLQADGSYDVIDCGYI